MTNPVMQALVNARLQEQDQKETALNAAVSSRLNLPAREGDKSDWPIFKAWCDQRGVTPYPARPAAVACFILDNGLLGIDALLKVVDSISIVHDGLADPTLGPAVSAAFDQVSPIEPPRSWPKEHKARFLALPRELQTYVAAHESQREKVIRRAHNDVAMAKQALIPQPAKVTNGTSQQNAA